MLAIHNHYVLTSNAMPQREPRSFNEQAAWFAAVQRRRFPILVVDNAGDIIGYAYVDRFAELKSFEPSIEGHIYLKPGSTGNRLGTALLRVLVKRASRLHKRSLIVRIDSTNIASIKIHKRCGFTLAGELRD